MNKGIRVDLFVEDRAHEEFLLAMLDRIAVEEGKKINVNVRSARGGHGQVLTEFSLYQKSVLKGLAGMNIPDLLVVAIDANCKSFNNAKKEIEAEIQVSYKDRTILACPDPYIERWYLADPDSLMKVIGIRPKVGRKKCQRDYYKGILIRTLREAGYPPTLGGIEFAKEIVQAMDLYRAAKAEKSLKHFLDDIIACIRAL
jgi:hypothetical protein